MTNQILIMYMQSLELWCSSMPLTPQVKQFPITCKTRYCNAWIERFAATVSDNAPLSTLRPQNAVGADQLMHDSVLGVPR